MIEMFEAFSDKTMSLPVQLIHLDPCHSTRKLMTSRKLHLMEFGDHLL